MKQVLLAVAALAAAVPAQAVTLVTFTVDWTAQPEQKGSATAQITVDIDNLPQIGDSGDPRKALNFVTDLLLIVRDIPTGDAKYSLADFTGISFYSPSKLDLGRELIGQKLENGCEFGLFTKCDGLNGDFNLYSDSGPILLRGRAIARSTDTPNGLEPFTLNVGSLAEPQLLTVTSIRPNERAPEAGVPEPATWALLIAGFGMVGFAARRRRQQLPA